MAEKSNYTMRREHHLKIIWGNKKEKEREKDLVAEISRRINIDKIYFLSTITTTTTKF